MNRVIGVIALAVVCASCAREPGDVLVLRARGSMENASFVVVQYQSPEPDREFLGRSVPYGWSPTVIRSFMGGMWADYDPGIVPPYGDVRWRWTPERGVALLAFLPECDSVEVGLGRNTIPEDTLWSGAVALSDVPSLPRDGWWERARSTDSDGRRLTIDKGGRLIWLQQQGGTMTSQDIFTGAMVDTSVLKAMPGYGAGR